MYQFDDHQDRTTDRRAEREAKRSRAMTAAAVAARAAGRSGSQLLVLPASPVVGLPGERGVVAAPRAGRR